MIRHLIAVAACAALIATSACAGITSGGAPPGGASPPAAGSVIPDLLAIRRMPVGQAIGAADLAVIAAANVAKEAADNGFLKGPPAATVKRYLVTADNALRVAHAAYTMGRETDARTRLGEALDALGGAKSILQPGT